MVQLQGASRKVPNRIEDSPVGCPQVRGAVVPQRLRVAQQVRRRDSNAVDAPLLLLQGFEADVVAIEHSPQFEFIDDCVDLVLRGFDIRSGGLNE